MTDNSKMPADTGTLQRRILSGLPHGDPRVSDPAFDAARYMTDPDYTGWTPELIAPCLCRPRSASLLASLSDPDLQAMWGKAK